MSNEFNIDQVISVDFEADSELNIQVGTAFQGASIDDTVISTKKTWSSQKISDELDTKADDSATTAALALKADSADVTTALASKANSADVYTKTETYSKAEVDAAIPSSASEISYNNTSSSLVATNTQAAIDELASTSGGGTAEDTTFDDTNVTFSANNVQSAFENIIKKLTQAEYDELTPVEQLNGTIYMIIDSDPPLSTGLSATNLDIQTAEYTTSSL